MELLGQFFPKFYGYGRLYKFFIFSNVSLKIFCCRGCFLTSSLIATLAVSLTIPLSMLADVMFKRVTYSFHFYLGAIPILVSFFWVALLTHYENWDPVMEFFKKCCRKLRLRRRRRYALKNLVFVIRVQGNVITFFHNLYITFTYRRLVREDRSDQNDRLIEDELQDEECEEETSTETHNA